MRLILQIAIVLFAGCSPPGRPGDAPDAPTSLPDSGPADARPVPSSRLVQQLYVKASNTDAHDLFGGSVSLSADGTVLAAGVYGEDSAATGLNGDQASNAASHVGAVYLVVRGGDAQPHRIYVKASSAGAGDFFGWSVALSADGATLAVGAFHERSAAIGVDADQLDDSAPEAGAAYVFTRNGTNWRQQAYLKASNTGAGDHFGKTVALSADGSTLAVGAVGEASAATGVGGDQGSNSAPRAGAVYVFVRDGTTWSQQAYVKAFDTEEGDRFGSGGALSADGSTLVVGAPGRDRAGGSDAGAVYVFERRLATWSQRASLEASNPGAGDAFGGSVALSTDGHILAVGASLEDGGATGIDGDQSDNASSGAGAVYVFASGGARGASRPTSRRPTRAREMRSAARSRCRRTARSSR